MGEKGNNEACITLVVYPCGEVADATLTNFPTETREGERCMAPILLCILNDAISHYLFFSCSSIVYFLCVCL